MATTQDKLYPQQSLAWWPSTMAFSSTTSCVATISVNSDSLNRPCRRRNFLFLCTWSTSRKTFLAVGGRFWAWCIGTDIWSERCQGIMSPDSMASQTYALISNGPLRAVLVPAEMITAVLYIPSKSAGTREWRTNRPSVALFVRWTEHWVGASCRGRGIR